MNQVKDGEGNITHEEYDNLISLNAGFDGKEPLLQASYCYDRNGRASFFGAFEKISVNSK